MWRCAWQWLAHPAVCSNFGMAPLLWDGGMLEPLPCLHGTHTALRRVPPSHSVQCVCRGHAEEDEG